MNVSSKKPKLYVRAWGIPLTLPFITLIMMLIDNYLCQRSLLSPISHVSAQTIRVKKPLTIRSDFQEYDAKSETVTAKGNVQMLYPDLSIQATASQVQYFSKDNRIVLSGDVCILQDNSNSICGETVTYLINEGRFVALPKVNQQVESIYMIKDIPVKRLINTPEQKTSPSI